MFIGSTYRYHTLTPFFDEHLQQYFDHIYLSKTFIDKLLIQNNIVLLKNFIVYYVNNNNNIIFDLNNIILNFNKQAVDKLKMIRKKNSPDYCYYTNAAVR